jgi:hypothetical protein
MTLGKSRTTRLSETHHCFELWQCAACGITHESVQQHRDARLELLCLQPACLHLELAPLLTADLALGSPLPQPFKLLGGV